jgi:hypothetical protein
MMREGLAGCSGRRRISGFVLGIKSGPELIAYAARWSEPAEKG